jgi:hypothetical protein
VARPKLANPMTPSERGRYAALSRWAKENPIVNATRGQQGLRARFLREVDEHAASVGEELTEKERQRRADVRYRLHMQTIRRQRPTGEAA